jgi:hypothetical protein
MVGVDSHVEENARLIQPAKAADNGGGRRFGIVYVKLQFSTRILKRGCFLWRFPFGN